MILHSQGGVVSTKIGRDLTILLNTGAKVRLRVKKTSLRLGDKVHVAFNHETGEVKDITVEGSARPDAKTKESLPWDNHPAPDDNYVGVLEMGVFSGTGE